MFTHKFSVGQCFQPVSNYILFFNLRQARRLSYAGQTKSPTHDEKGGKKFVRSSHFPPTPAGAGFGTCIEIEFQPVAVASSGQSLSHSA